MPEFLDHATNPAGDLCVFLEARAAPPAGWKPAGTDAVVIIDGAGSVIIAHLSPDAVSAASSRGRLLAVEVDRDSRKITGESWLDLTRG